MKEKLVKLSSAFTLVELLAVISLLGLIGLITVPIISNTIKNSEKKAFTQTLNSIISAGKYYNAENDYKGITSDGINVIGDEIQYENKDQIKSGKLYYNDKKYYVEKIQNDKFCGTGYLGKYIIYKGNCDTGVIIEDQLNK